MECACGGLVTQLQIVVAAYQGLWLAIQLAEPLFVHSMAASLAQLMPWAYPIDAIGLQKQSCMVHSGAHCSDNMLQQGVFSQVKDNSTILEAAFWSWHGAIKNYNSMGYLGASACCWQHDMQWSRLILSCTTICHGQMAAILEALFIASITLWQCKSANTS